MPLDTDFEGMKRLFEGLSGLLVLILFFSFILWIKKILKFFGFFFNWLRTKLLVVSQ